jgi:AAA+ superfamily predicted ATPase
VKKIFLLVAAMLLYVGSTHSTFNFDNNLWTVDTKNLPGVPARQPLYYYRPDKIDMHQHVIHPDPNAPLPITLDYKKPVPVTLTFPDDVGSEFLEGLNDILKEDIAPQLKETWQTLIGTFLNSENAIRFASPIALFGILALSGFYGTRVFWKVLEKNLLSPKPQIVQPGSKYGWIDRWKRSRAGYKTPAMIFDESVKAQLEEIKEKTKNIRDNIRKGKKITYDNLLLYGKPGTGKTLFAQILADYTDMDFLCVTAASLLQSGVEGIKYFDEILEMANKSKYGVILFIDEAEALFVNRDLLKPDSDHYKVLNHLLAATGSGSNKLMIIAATNHAYVMDPAMGRRFQERIKMPLPNEQTRKDLLNLYIKEYLSDEAFVGFGEIHNNSLLTPQRITAIVQATAGLSHAEIKNMVELMNKYANASENGILREQHIQNAVDRTLAKKEAFKKDKAKLKKHNAE